MQQETGAFAVDMEAYYLSAVCRKRGIPFAAVKCVSDDATCDLPGLAEGLPELHWIRLVGRVLSSPSSWPGMLRLLNGCRVASRNLGDVLGLALLRLV